MRARETARRWKRAWQHDSWVRPFLARYRKALLASIGLGLLTMIFAAGLMFTSGFLISDAAEQPALGLYSLLVPLGLVQVFGVGKPFLGYLERLASHDWVLRLTSALRTRLYRSMEGEGVFWMATHRAGELLGLLAGDIGHLQNLYLRSVFPLALAWGLWLLCSLLFGFFSPLFGLFMLLSLGVLVVLVPLAAVLAGGARQMREKELSNALYTSAADDVAGLADWQCAGREEEYVERVMAADAELSRAQAGSARVLRRSELCVQLLFGVVSVCVLIWAAAHFGQMAQAAAATGVAGRPADFIAAFVLGFFPLLEAFQPLPAACMQAGAHLDSIERLNSLGEPPAAHAENPAGSPSSEAQGTPILAFSHACFAHAGQDELLHDINLRIEPGEHVAILGPSGAGKSTLLSLARGDLSPTTGSVELDGTPVNKLGDAVCSQVGLIQQSTYLFNRSLFENLRMGNRSVTQEDARQALEAVGLGELLAALPKGLDTMVDEAGVNFSGGERHRIALARILLKHTPVVLLDEPTVSLDPITEHALLDTLFRVLGEQSILMVTHHLAGIEHFDRVVFIDDGRIHMEGSPAQLAQESPRFRQLLELDRGL